MSQAQCKALSCTVSFKNFHSLVKEVGPSPFKSQAPWGFSDLSLSHTVELRNHPASKPLMPALVICGTLQERLHGRAGKPQTAEGHTCHQDAFLGKRRISFWRPSETPLGPLGRH